MNEPEKCAMCKGLGYYYVLSNDIHPYVPQKGVAKACDCKSLLHKYNRLLEFVKSLNVVTTKSSSHHYYDGYVDAKNNTAMIAEDFLKEIGEL